MEEKEELREDRRVTFTKMFLKEALITLMKEKPIAKITPTELCRVANINRNTFYAHYKSPSELLLEIEKELYYDILDSVPSGNNSEKGLRLEELCKALKDHGESCKVVLSENGDRNFLLEVIASARDISIEKWKSLAPTVSEEEMMLYFDYCANGSVSIIYNWVNDGMKMSYKELAKILEKLNTAVMISFLNPEI